MIQQKEILTPQKANSLLKDGQPLKNLIVEGNIVIEIADSYWEKEVVIDNCIIEYFSGSVTQFKSPVRLINSHFKNCQFVFTYFLGGLIIDNCLFDNFLDFQAGGHNKPNNPIGITNNNFSDFVNFFDCWYEGEVIISNNNFQKGTNLLGKPFNIPVTFNINATIENNIGQLDFNNEGKKLKKISADK